MSSVGIPLASVGAIAIVLKTTAQATFGMKFIVPPIERVEVQFFALEQATNEPTAIACSEFPS